MEHIVGRRADQCDIVGMETNGTLAAAVQRVLSDLCEHNSNRMFELPHLRRSITFFGERYSPYMG